MCSHSILHFPYYDSCHMEPHGVFTFTRAGAVPVFFSSGSQCLAWSWPYSKCSTNVWWVRALSHAMRGETPVTTRRWWWHGLWMCAPWGQTLTSLVMGPKGSPGPVQWHPRKMGYHLILLWQLWFRKVFGTGLEIRGPSMRAMTLPKGNLLVPLLCRTLSHKVGQRTWC